MTLSSKISGDPNPDILHLVEHEKFIPAFIALVAQALTRERHGFFFVHNGCRFTEQTEVKVTRDSDFRHRIQYYVALIKRLNSSNKIVLHGLFNSRLIFILFLQPWLWKRCYWMIWGGDLYTYAIHKNTVAWHIKEFFRRPLIRHFGHLITYLPGDIELARQWYGARGEYHECLVYPSNTFEKQNLPENRHTGIHVLIGNSADPSNRHAEILEKLQPYAESDLHIYAPLSYGNSSYADAVEAEGKLRFGEKFTALRSFMSYPEYLKLLAGIDIAIFNHERQQGMGNIISLLGMGKTVYLNPRISTWQMLTRMGLVVGDVDALSLQPLEAFTAHNNQRIIEAEFSRAKLITQLRHVLEN